MMRRLFQERQPSVAGERLNAARREQLVARLTDEPVTIDVRRSRGAKRMTLRIPPGHANPVVTIPQRASMSSAERFVKSQAAWLTARLSERAPAQPFIHGGTIPLRGEPHLIEATGAVRGVVTIVDDADGPTLLIPGTPQHLPRRLADYLRRAARDDLHVAVEEFAARVNRRPTALRIKDTRAQWGSCSPSGVLSFSWRLVLAPPFVLRYVAAHEVAHLIELNHSAAFWKLNAELDPDHERARAWLKRHGRMLHSVGAEGPSAQI
ncbi:M48 family metallopeptidase [Acuticoccus sp. M5D2P5]|uniref:M48 family metallopeptidase n=1 Tax=Acuticoccus kalidii TaxID=2910977 RepID=UPI001F3B98FB|nr:SprT family zinc-dependent metalloprotease [Acuticoccus kalidii]MCF3933625.1 M48 family metallopeptidase [Acuticoccus kalidii]